VTPWPAQLAALLTTAGKNNSVLNLGCNSIGFNQVSNSCGTGAAPGTGGSLISNAATIVDPVLTRQPNARLIIFAGTNDIWLGGSTGAQTCTLAQTYLNARLTFGWPAGHILWVAMLPRYNPGNSAPVNMAAETERQNYISCMLTYLSGVGITPVRLDLDANIGMYGDEMSLTYYRGDDIHPNNTGLGVVAADINAVYPKWDEDSAQALMLGAANDNWSYQRVVGW
jgi:lysophospholipase L1-like esterase